MLTFLILLTLLYFFYAGARRGMWLQLVHVAGYLVSFLAAWALCKPLGQTISLFVPYPSATEQSRFVFFSNKVGLTLDDAFYRGVAFILILMIGWLITRYLALWVHDLSYSGHDAALRLFGGGVLNLVIGYLFIFLVIYLAALVPVSGIQSLLADSFAAKTIIHTPLLEQMITNLWIIA
ncbi:CvpA family protein [Lacticaseibacillus mingshuiensis]|uniref:CvpA family protein n=1 Tax=Lacticaseibacillus mingshuiensis TaxID=2799574 RepID=UPI00194E9E21|nr:CvpA family protein [Lacticaseibacillus mingshuiensis]